MSQLVLTQTQDRLRAQVAELDQMLSEIELLVTQLPWMPPAMRAALREELKAQGIREGSVVELRMQVEGVLSAKRAQLRVGVYQT